MRTGTPARVIGTITDITERKHLEDTLRQKTESLNIAQTAAGVATMDLNFARQQLDLLGQLLRAARDPPSTTQLERLGRAGSRACTPTTSSASAARPSTPTREHPTYRCEYRLQLADGRERWIAEKADVTHGPDGEILRITGALIDITLEAHRGRAHLDREAPRTHHARHARRRVGVRCGGRTVLVRAAFRGAAGIRSG